MVWSKTVVWSAWTILHKNFIPWPSSLINRTPSSGRLFFLPRIGLLGPRDAAPGHGSGPELPSSTFFAGWRTFHGWPLLFLEFWVQHGRGRCPLGRKV